MFDRKKEVELSMPAPSGTKTVVVRYPSDEQLIQRAAALKTIVRNLGRGKTMTEPAPNSEQTDYELYQVIRKDADGNPYPGDELDPFEAQRMIQHLLRVEVLDSRREGNQFVMTLDTPAGDTKHTMNMPSAKQVIDYRRSVVQVIDNRRSQEIRMNLRASQELYTAIAAGAEGYQGEVPVNHKAAVVSEVLAMLDSEDDGEQEIRSFRK